MADPASFVAGMLAGAIVIVAALIFAFEFDIGDK